MKFQQIMPVLRTWEYFPTIHFYEDVLGFRRVVEDKDREWAILRRDEVEIMVAGFDLHTTEEVVPALTGSVYIQVDDVDALWESLREKAQVCSRLEDQLHGMREFAICDNNGYMLQFGTVIRNTIC